MMRPLLSYHLKLIFILFAHLLTVHSMQFTQQTYKAIVSNSVKPESRIQQVTAIPTRSYNNVTYTTSTNDYVHVTTSGAVLWKGHFPEESISIEVEARNEEGEAVTANVILTQSQACPEFKNSIQMDIPENINTPLPVLYMETNCQGSEDTAPSLTDPSSYFTIENKVLYIHRLNYSSSISVETDITYNNQTIQVSVNTQNEVDMSPYTTRGASFQQHDYPIDVDQYTKPSSKNLVVYFDRSGDSSKWRIEYSESNNLSGRPLLQASFLRKQANGKTFVGVTFPVDWQIRRSVDIDVILVDDNIDRQMSINNKVTFRFRFIYTDIDELNNLVLADSYDVSLSRDGPDYTKVLEISHNFSTSLSFSISGESLSECGDFLDITPHQGIVYVSDYKAMNDCQHDAVIEYQITVTSGLHHRTASLNVKLSGVATTNVTQLDTESCAVNKDEMTCSEAAGSGSAQCMWRITQSDTSNYTTCTANDDCGDGVCSELENMAASICPQDCLESSKWFGQNLILCKNQKLGLCEASGVCYCEKADCECRPQADLGIVYKGDPDQPIITVNLTEVKEVRPTPEEECGVGCIVGVAVAIAIMIIIAAVLILYCKYHSQTRHKKVANINAWRVNGPNLRLPEFTACPDYEGSTPSTVMSVISDWPSMQPFFHYASQEVYDEKWELSRDSLIIGDYIGEGEFGRVMEARYRKSPLDDWNPVAVKMLKDGASRTEYTDLLSEYTLLKEVDHPNVIKLIGAATLNGPFHLVVEYCEHGSLKNYLRNVRGQEPIYMNGATQFYTQHAAELMGFSWQISKGMQYLSDMKLVHRDLATRNILIAANNVIKISDFGMTKDIYEEDAYKKKGQGRIPVKWMAPESLYHQIYTTKSDVWSFGIVLWEIATLGATPYPGIPAERMYHLLQEGYRMDRPETCSTAMYNLMRKCWEFDALNRPSFKEIRHSLEQMLQDQDDYLDLSVAQAQRLCHGSTSISTTSEDDSSLSETPNQLTVALLHNNHQPKSVEDYMVSDDSGYNERRPLRYTTLDFTEEE